MKVTKWYCDMCGKEIKESPEAKFIPIRMNVGKHGESNTDVRIMYFNGSCMDFCEDCKATIAVLFGGKSNE
jgi:hypothetical protein